MCRDSALARSDILFFYCFAFLLGILFLFSELFVIQLLNPFYRVATRFQPGLIVLKSTMTLAFGFPPVVGFFFNPQQSLNHCAAYMKFRVLLMENTMLSLI